MAERFEKLFTLPPNLYSEESPIIISAGALLKDNETGKVIVQIKYHSISNVPIVALKVSIEAYDISGVKLEGIDDYQYLDLNIKNGQDFGSNKAIVLPDAVSRSFSITSVSAILSNGTTRSVAIPMKALSKSATLISMLKNEELVKQYQIETSKEAEYIPQKEADLWCCTCGEWNSNDNCTRCGLNFPIANKFLDSFLLEPKAKERIIKEKQYQEQQKQIAEKAQKQRKKKIIIFAILATIAIVIVSSLLYYTSQHKYDEIAGIYALQDLEEAEEALYEFQEDVMDEYGFNPYSYEIEIKGSGKVYGLWFVNNRGTMTPRAATVKSVSENGVVEFDILDYPNEKVTFTINTNTGEATYSSRGLTLSYHRITEDLANNGYIECSSDDVRKEISFIQDLFELKTVEAIKNKYPQATAGGTICDVIIDASFCGATGTYKIWLDDVWKITFEQGIYDTNTEKQALIDNLDGVLGKNSYSEWNDTYSWESDKYNLQIDYVLHKGVYFFPNVPPSNSTDTTEPDNNDKDDDSNNNDNVAETFISNGRFEFSPRTFVERFDAADKSTSAYNYVYMRMNGETSLFYELAEISGGYNNVRSVGMISFVKNVDTTLSIEEDYTENITTKIDVLVENADDVPPILTSCMCAVDPSLDFTSAYNLSMDVAEKAGTTEGYTHNGVNYVIFADGEYYYIIISVAGASVNEGHKTECELLGHSWVDATCTAPMTCSRCNKINGTTLGHDWGNPTCTTPRSCCVCFEVDPNSKPLGHSFVDGECMICGADEVQEPNQENPSNSATLFAAETDIYLNGTSELVYFWVNPSSIDAIVDYVIEDESIVEIQRGGWGGNTSQLLFIPIATGETTVTVYIDGYEGGSVTINVSANIDGGVSSGFDPDGPFITSTESEFNLKNGSEVAYLTVWNMEDKGEYFLTYDISIGSDVVDCIWGDWDGDTISLTFIPLDSGNAFVTVYIDGYYDNSAITIPVFVP